MYFYWQVKKQGKISNTVKKPQVKKVEVQKIKFLLDVAVYYITGSSSHSMNTCKNE